MKQKISVQLPEDLLAALETTAERRGTTRTAIVEAALRQFLSTGAETDDAVLRRRLEWMSGQLEQMERDLRVVNETVALHARFHLTVAPPIPQSHQRAACLMGQERFDVFAAQVGRRVHLGTPLMRETMGRLTTANPDLFTREVDEGAPLGAPSREPAHGEPAAGERNRERSAAAAEGGSNGNFLGDRKSLPR